MASAARANAVPIAAPGPNAGALCTTGTPTPVVAAGVGGIGPFNWNCTGGVGGASAICAAPALTNGQCGPANGAYLSQAPNIALECNAGTPSFPVTGTGPWSWTCTGAGGGGVAACAANPDPCGRVRLRQRQLQHQRAPPPTCAPWARPAASAAAAPARLTGSCSLANKPSITANCSTTGRSSQKECLFNWAEDSYPTLLAPTRPTTVLTSNFYLRYYGTSIAYMAATNSNLYYLGSLTAFNVADLGALTNWYTVSGCK